MRINKTIIILCVISTVIAFLLIYNDNIFKSSPKNTIKNFLKEKVALYYKRKELEDIFQVDIDEGFDANGVKKGEEEKLNEILKDVRPFLTERAYKKSLANRRIISQEMIEGEYSKVKLEILRWLELNKTDEKSVYLVEYRENFYVGDEDIVYRAKQITEEYTLERIDGEWKITRIEPKSNRVFEDYSN